MDPHTFASITGEIVSLPNWNESGILDFVNAMLSDHGRPATLGNEQNVVALKELDES